MTKEALAKILKDHAAWLREDPKGNRADLSWAKLRGANLSGADLSWAKLRGANLSEADLSWAKLRGAKLSGADLRGANLSGADLRGANLSGANLSGANLSGANLSGANLSGADLRGADLSGAHLPEFQIVPEEGAFHAFKKLRNGIVAKLQIPAKAKRTSSLIGRKCRAEFVKTLALYGTKEPIGYGLHNETKYEVGKITKADAFDDDIRVECSGGIHFFITRKEAEEYASSWAC